VSDRVLEVIQAGVVPYAEALAWQRELAQARIERRIPHDVLLLLEHPPVVTLGRNSKDTHVLRSAGVDVFEVERGGDVTFHGPGQLVGYPIIDLTGYKQANDHYIDVSARATDKSADPEAKQINSRVSGWDYEIPDYRYDEIFQSMDGLLKPLPAKKVSASHAHRTK